MLPAWEWARGIVALADPELASEALDDMSVGERDRRLLRFREALFGPRLTCRSGCPCCGEPVEVTLELAALQVGGANSSNGKLSDDGYEVHFRLPNLRDVEYAARGANPQTMRELLLQRCITGAERAGRPIGVAEVPSRAVERVLATMASADPQADVQLEMSCPGCGQTWAEVFDIVTFLRTEIDAWADRLLREIHLLASAYGWTEVDVLALSATRRARYVEMIAS